MSNQKILYMLIGPKGAGKTHIGTIVDRDTDISFLRVESIWLGLQPGEDGWTKVEAALIQLLFQMIK
jgi:shikimate kinase